jgi:hypothetical protein
MFVDSCNGSFSLASGGGKSMIAVQLTELIETRNPDFENDGQ